MKDTLSDIREKLIAGVYKNEEQVRLNLVARILLELRAGPTHLNNPISGIPA